MSSNEFIPPAGFVEMTHGESRRFKRRRPHPHRVFNDLPLSVRRDKAVAQGWIIRSNHNGAGVFNSHDYLPGSRDWPLEKGGNVQWADVMFLSEKGPRSGVIFNATVYTVASRLAEDICAQAAEAVDARVSAQDQERSRLRVFTRRPPGSDFVEMEFSPHQVLPSLDGLTREGAKAAWLREQWIRLGSLVHEGEAAKFLPGYAYGTGLDLITRHTNLTVETIAEAIADFRERGEVEYALPLDFEAQRETVEAILLGKLWRWDVIQAKASGKERPARPGDKADALLGYESNAIRL